MSKENIQIFYDNNLEEEYGEEQYKNYLEKQNKELKQRMNKAVELIKTNMYVMRFGEMRNLATKEDYEQLLSILKGEDEECIMK